MCPQKRTLTFGDFMDDNNMKFNKKMKIDDVNVNKEEEMLKYLKKNNIKLDDLKQISNPTQSPSKPSNPSKPSSIIPPNIDKSDGNKKVILNNNSNNNNNNNNNEKVNMNKEKKK